MNKYIKQMVSFILVAILLVSSSCCLAFAQTDLGGIMDVIDSLPNYDSITSVNDPNFTYAMDVSGLLVSDILPRLSDEEYYMVENASKAFDVYIALSLLKMREGMPTQETTKENIFEQYRWVQNVTNGLDDLFYFVYYSSYEETQDGEVYFVGEKMIDDFSEDILAVNDKIDNVVLTMSVQELEELNAQALALELERFPISFTSANFWDYAFDFYVYVYISKDEFFENLSSDTKSEFTTMVTSFETCLEDTREKVIEELNKKIENLCDMEGIMETSTLALSLQYEPIADVLYNDIELLGMLYDQEASDLLENYAMFQEFYDMVYSSYEIFAFGDMDVNEEIDAKDALIVLKMAVQKMEMTEDDLWIGDVDGNGVLDAKDALYILKYAVNKIEMFPVEEMIYG